jgi:Flp pilus assembly protein TadG
MRRILRRFIKDQSGVAALEFAAAAAFLIVGGMNVADIGRYAFMTSEVTSAVQAGAQAAAVACDVDHVPATIDCPGLNTAVQTAITSTRLGSQVTLNGPITEGYYCLNTSGGLVYAATASSAPTDCTAVPKAAASATPTLYLQVHVQTPFDPLFPGLTLAQSFTTTISRTAWMRMR